MSLLYHHTALHCILNQGKIDFYLHTNLLILLFCFIYKHSSVKFKPGLQKNILKFGYGANYKYKGMLPHSFDRFYIITKLILPTMNDFNLSPIKYDKEYKNLHYLGDMDSAQIKEIIRDA